MQASCFQLGSLGAHCRGGCNVMARRLWDGLFPAISMNREVTAIRDSGPPDVNFWALEELPATQQPCWCWLLSLPVVSRDLRIWIIKSQYAGPRWWDANERNQFSKPRLWLLPICRKAGLNSLTWDTWFIHNHLLLFRLLAPAASFCITWLLPHPHPHSWNRSLRVTWDAVSQTWSSQNSHQRKHNSQLLGCDHLLSRRLQHPLFTVGWAAFFSLTKNTCREGSGRVLDRVAQSLRSWGSLSSEHLDAFTTQRFSEPSCSGFYRDCITEAWFI